MPLVTVFGQALFLRALHEGHARLHRGEETYVRVQTCTSDVLVELGRAWGTLGLGWGSSGSSSKKKEQWFFFLNWKCASRREL